MPKGEKKFIDLTGKKFGRLTVLNIHKRGTPEGVEWFCKCECGNSVITTSKKLKSGNTKSCGCYQRDKVSQTFKKHGMRNTRQYRIWGKMKDRCLNKNNKYFDDYGGRGIKVCSKWLSFEGFWEDMKEGYSDYLSIDRINNDGNYEKSNCRWATAEQQNCNTRQNHYETVDGVTETISRLSKMYDKSERVVRRRIGLGWSIEDALKKPVKKANKGA